MRGDSPPNAQPHGRPPFADSQEQTILDLLLEAGPHGVSKKFLVFERHFTQASARIHHLEQRGFKIRHEMRPGDTYVTFVLESVPERETAAPTDRPAATPSPKPPDRRSRFELSHRADVEREAPLFANEVRP
jgi:hypothetical protein